MADGATLESAAPVSPATRLAILAAPFHCERGGKIDQPVLAYRTWGKLNSARDNVILICHALTGSADVDDWWPGLLGSGCPIDTDRWFVVCSNVLGGCYGSSGPYSRGQHGRRLGLDFPQVTIRDMVRAQQQLLEQLGIERVHCVLGPSLGGMQAIEWTTSFSDRVSRQMLIGSSARHSSWCIGISETQRAALRADPNWRGGHYSDAEPPAQGLAAARMIAMVSYRSWQNFDQRFSRTTADNGQFAVNSYLQYQGQKLVGRFDAASYHRLTEAMDSHDIARGRKGDLADILARQAQPSLVVSVSSDVLYPPHEQAAIAERLPNVRYHVLESDHGHDGFLIDVAPLFTMMRDFLASEYILPDSLTA